MTTVMSETFNDTHKLIHYIEQIIDEKYRSIDRFSFDSESGFVWDNENKEWLVTAEELWFAVAPTLWKLNHDQP